VEAEGRRVRLDADALATSRLEGAVSARIETLDELIQTQSERRRRHSERTREMVDRLDLLRRERAASERRLSEIRERMQRAEVDETEARIRAETLTEAVRRDLDCEPADAMATECPELPPATSPSSRLRELERELRLMGAINPLALEEFQALSERHAV